jgi:hypothetical protein
MKRVLRRGGFGAALIFGILGVSASCTDERTGMFILGNVVISAPACVARPESGGVLHSSGKLDIGLTSTYTASLLVGSQLTPRGDKPNLRAETMITNITGAEVHLTGDDGTVEFTVPANGVIRPEGSADPGFGIVFVDLIPAAEGERIRNDMQRTDSPDRPIGATTRVAEFTVFGKTIGGLEVESAPTTYVIDICDGCSVYFPPDAIDGDGRCGSELSDVEAPPCRLGQDDPVDCRACIGTGLEICRPPLPPAP